MKRFILSTAAMALMLSPFAAQANDYNNVIDISQSLDVSINKSINEDTSVTNHKTLDVNIDANINVRGSENLDEYDSLGYGLTVDGLASAEINNNQILKLNTVINKENSNTATIGGSALEGAEGNIGVNVVAGDNNAQDNLAAMTASEQDKSMADAEIFKAQLSLENFTCNKGMKNRASLDGDALMGAIGNIGVNVAAGNNNAQSNMLAIAVAPAKVGIAKVSINQESAGNMTINKPVKVEEVQWVPVRLDLSAGFAGGYEGGYFGYAGGGYSGRASGSYSGTYSGISDQYGDVYLDTWGPGTQEPPYGHPTNGPTTGHVDVDSAAQGAQDRNNDGGALSFNENGTANGRYSGSESGYYGGIEIGSEGGELGGVILGTVSGNIPVVIKRNVNMINTASLGGNALRGATGNIGVNIAAGTGNLQANALAVTYIAPVNGGGGESIIK